MAFEGSGEPGQVRAADRGADHLLAQRARWVADGARLHVRSGQTLLPEWIAILTLLLLLWSGIGLTLYQLRAFALAAASQQTFNLANLFADSTKRIVTSIDDMLLDLREHYQHSESTLDLQHWQATNHRPQEFYGYITVSDAEGHVLGSSRPGSSSSIANRSYFMALQAMHADELYISPPLTGRDTGEQVLVFARKWLDQTGQFRGIVYFSIYPTLLSQAFRVEDFAGGIVSVIGNDGIIRAHYPLEKIGKNMAGTEFLAMDAPAKRSGFLYKSPIDGVKRIVSYSRVAGTPLLVTVAFDLKKVLSGVHAWSAITVVAGCIVSAAIALLGKLWLALRKRALLARIALAETVSSISQGLVMFDAKGALSLANARGAALLRDMSDEVLALRGNTNDTLEAVRSDGAVIELRRHAAQSGALVFTFTDITAHKQAEARITAAAMHDSLTGLPNRTKFHLALATAIRHHSASAQPFAVLRFNLDDFKQVNDSYGFEYADSVLKAVAERLACLVEPGGALARIGGDEFAVLLANAERGATEWFAQRTQNAFKNGIKAAEHSAILSFSVGIASFPSDGTDAPTLLKKAGIALSRAKAEGVGALRFFEAEMEQTLHLRRTLQSDLREAIANNDIFLLFQPQFHANSLSLVGFEALARWNHPTLGAVAPDLFIRIAEESGLIESLGDQVLHRACGYAASWPRALRIGVNLSPLQFRGTHLPNQVEAVLWETGLARHRLELEVTEGVLIREQKHAEAILSALSALGVRLALDDFGTGYSSLSYLRRFRFDTLKIDKSFVQTLVEDEGTRTILDSILAMAKRLDLDVIAEGVETEAQMKILQQEGCTELQGYLLGRPMAPEDAIALIKAQDFPRAAACSL